MLRATGPIRRKKTRPPAEYDACAALPCPDIEIGSRRPVAIKATGAGQSDLFFFTVGQEKLRAPRVVARSGGDRPTVAILRACDAWHGVSIESSCFAPSAGWM